MRTELARPQGKLQPPSNSLFSHPSPQQNPRTKLISFTPPNPSPLSALRPHLPLRRHGYIRPRLPIKLKPSQRISRRVRLAVEQTARQRPRARASGARVAASCRARPFVPRVDPRAGAVAAQDLLRWSRRRRRRAVYVGTHGWWFVWRGHHSRRLSAGEDGQAEHCAGFAPEAWCGSRSLSLDWCTRWLCAGHCCCLSCWSRHWGWILMDI